MRKILKLLNKRDKNFTKIEENAVFYQIGNYSILLPASHKLPVYQKAFLNYDKKLKCIIQTIESTKKNGVIIDIGANVGDTVAYIRSFSKSKIYCIEGDSFYLEYLKKNIQSIPNVELIDSYVSGRKQSTDYLIQRSNGTAKLDCLDENKKGVPLKWVTLLEVIDKFGIDPKSINLIKIDTDGFDFDILLENKELISTFRPAIYFEYDIGFNKSDTIDSIEVVKLMDAIGYNFIVYDNFGNLLTIVNENAIVEFDRLNHYLYSCKKNGGGIYYFDIFATIDKKAIRLIYESDDLNKFIV